MAPSMVAGNPVAVQSPASTRFATFVRAAGRNRSCAAVAANVARRSFTTRHGGSGPFQAEGCLHVGPDGGGNRIGALVHHAVGRADGHRNMAALDEHPLCRAADQADEAGRTGIRFNPEMDVQDRLELAWRWDAGQQVGGHPGRHRNDHGLDRHGAIGRMQGVEAAIGNAQRHDAPPAQHVVAARLEPRNGWINQALGQTLARKGRDAGAATAQQRLAHDRAKQPRKARIRRGVQRRYRERFDQPMVQRVVAQRGRDCCIAFSDA